MTHHIAISCSYKFEDLNVLLEILKLNFKSECHITVICNLNKELFQKWKHIIEFDLIDMFFHAPEPQCFPQNTTRDTKRRQPLEMFERLMGRLPEEFDHIFLEGDYYPLREDVFYAQLEKLGSLDIVANRFVFTDDTTNFSEENAEAVSTALSQMHKMPKGYIHPSLMYFAKGIPTKMSNFIKEAKPQLLDGTKNFEGCLGIIFDGLNLTRENYGRFFPITYPDLKRIDPVLHTTHQHNILNMQDVFHEYEIKNGVWVNRVRSGESFSRAIDNLLIKRNVDTLVYSDLELHND